MAAREQFLERVRRAVASGARPGVGTTIPPRARVGYQGAGGRPLACLRDEFKAVGGHFHLVADDRTAIATVLEVLEALVARSVLVGRGSVLDRLQLPSCLGSRGLAVHTTDALDPATVRMTLFSVDVGISGVDQLIAETGSLVVMTSPHEPRSLTLLPPAHIAIAEEHHLVPDVFDVFDKLCTGSVNTPPSLPSCVTLITGPSKTGDIELRLVTGVHGPGEVHLIVIQTRSD